MKRAMGESNMNLYERVGRKINEKIMRPLYRRDIQREVRKRTARKEPSGAYYPKQKVVCVATTLPARLHVLASSIESILYQDVRPHKIVIYLGDEAFENVTIPERLREMEKYGVEYRYVKDMRVHTKYYYAFQEFNDCYVMTFDDDIVYHPKLLQTLLRAAERYPDCVICSRAHLIRGDAGGGFAPYMEWGLESGVSARSHMLIATGVGGVLYQPSKFDDELYEIETFMKLTPNNDDLWLKAMEMKSSIPVFSLGTKGRFYMETDGSQVVSLNSVNIGQNRNDLYWKAIMDHMKIDYAQLKALNKMSEKGEG